MSATVTDAEVPSDAPGGASDDTTTSMATSSGTPMKAIDASSSGCFSQRPDSIGKT